MIKRDELASRDGIEDKRLTFARDSIEPQLAAKQAELEQLKASAEVANPGGGSVARPRRYVGRAPATARGSGTARNPRHQHRPRRRPDKVEGRKSRSPRPRQKIFRSISRLRLIRATASCPVTLSGSIPRSNRELSRSMWRLMARFQKARAPISASMARSSSSGSTTFSMSAGRLLRRRSNTVGVFKLITGSEALRTPVKFRPQLGEHHRNSRGPERRRSGHSLRHQRLRFARPHQPELTQNLIDQPANDSN